MKNPCKEKQCLMQGCCTELCKDGLDYKVYINTKFKFVLQKLADRMKDKEFAKDVYRALSNMRWKYKDNELFSYSCTWRYAGDIVSGIREKNEGYMAFYLSGNEGYVSEEIREHFKKHGWTEHPWE